ncbi:MAG: glycosyltransferase family 9 protein, partial [Planctomycetes bacterium]|nr:glycosyltransferase family 9 protein [Planctomycetota bacterium]
LKSFLVPLAIKYDRVIGPGQGISRDKLYPYLINHAVKGPFQSSWHTYQGICVEGLNLLGRPEKAEYIQPNAAKTPLKKILIGTGATWPSKSFAKEKWLDLLQVVALDCSDVEIELLYGSEIERKFNQSLLDELNLDGLSLAPKMSLGELRDYLHAVDLYIGNDSGPTYLALSQGVSCMTFFGPSLPAYYQHGQNHVYREKCQYGKTFHDRCPELRKCYPCSAIEDIDVVRVWKETLELVKGENES